MQSRRRPCAGMFPSCPRADVPYPPVCFRFTLRIGGRRISAAQKARAAALPVPAHGRKPECERSKTGQDPSKSTAGQARTGGGARNAKREKTAWPKRFSDPASGCRRRSLWDDCKTPQIDGIMIPQKPRNVKRDSVLYIYKEPKICRFPGVYPAFTVYSRLSSFLFWHRAPSYTLCRTPKNRFFSIPVLEKTSFFVSS